MRGLTQLALSDSDAASLALTQLRVVTASPDLWAATTPDERAACASALGTALSAESSHLPRRLHEHVVGALLYRTGSFAFGNHISVLRELMRCFRVDLNDWRTEKITRAELDARVSALVGAAHHIVAFCTAQMGAVPPGSPSAANLVSIVKAVFELHALAPAVVSAAPLMHFAVSLVAQLSSAAATSLPERYVNAVASCLSTALQDSVQVDSVAAACSALLPYCGRHRKAAFFVAQMIDRDPPFLAALLTGPNVGRVFVMLLEYFLATGTVADDIDDMHDNDEGSYLAVCVARKAPAHALATLQGLLEGLAGMNERQRDALYRLVSLCANADLAGLFAKLLPWLENDQHHALVQRRVCNVVESFACYVESQELWRRAAARVLQVAFNTRMDVGSRVHACLALRSLVEFARVPVEPMLRELAPTTSRMLCQLTVECVGSSFLICLVPLFSSLLVYVDLQHVGNIVETLRGLWSEAAASKDEVVLMVLQEVVEHVVERCGPGTRGAFQGLQ